MKFFAQLQIYNQRNNGHTWVKRSEGSLAIWVDWQRQMKKRGKIRSDREQRLESIHFTWVVNEANLWKEDRDTSENDEEWERMFEQLEEFRDKHGHCFVPVVKKDKNKLGRWVRRQRAVFGEG